PHLIQTKIISIRAQRVHTRQHHAPRQQINSLSRPTNHRRSTRILPRDHRPQLAHSVPTVIQTTTQPIPRPMTINLRQQPQKRLLLIVTQTRHNRRQRLTKHQRHQPLTKPSPHDQTNAPAYEKPQTQPTKPPQAHESASPYPADPTPIPRQSANAHHASSHPQPQPSSTQI